jgi:hypothetical protein
MQEQSSDAQGVVFSAADYPAGARARLMREQGWNAAETDLYIKEYMRCVIWMTCADEMVWPCYVGADSCELLRV